MIRDLRDLAGLMTQARVHHGMIRNLIASSREMVEMGAEDPEFLESLRAQMTQADITAECAGDQAREILSDLWIHLGPEGMEFIPERLAPEGMTERGIRRILDAPIPLDLLPDLIRWA